MTPIYIDEKFLLSEWYSDIVHFQKNFECPSEFSKNQCKILKVEAIKYCIINENLYWKDPLNVLFLFLTESETKGIIDQFHAGIYGGHYASKATTYKVLRAGFYWPTLFAQVGENVRGCTQCQMFVGKQKLALLPLVPVLVSGPFLQQGLDFIREIHPASSNQHIWILITTDYFIKWVEALPVKNSTDTVVINFIEGNVLSRFRFPQQIVTDKAAAFSSVKVIQFCQNY